LVGIDGRELSLDVNAVDLPELLAVVLVLGALPVSSIARVEIEVRNAVAVVAELAHFRETRIDRNHRAIWHKLPVNEGISPG
jgi:hypothetical protein